MMSETITKVFRAMLCMAFLSFIASCSAMLPAHANYIVKDSGLRISSVSNIYWIDDEQILFQEVIMTSGARNRVSLWNVRTGEVQRFHELSGSLCYYEGYVHSWEADHVISKFWVTHGTLHKFLREDAQPRNFDNETCRRRSEMPPLPDEIKGYSVKRLRPEHGLLVLGAEKDDRNTPVSYFPNGAKEGIAMPFKRREFSISAITYAPFKKAYFITSRYFRVDERHPHGGYNFSPWPKEVPQPIWWLYPDGRAETLYVPPEAGFASNIFAAGSGVFFVAPAYIDGPGGLFKVENEQVARLLSARIEKFAVSPDGCKLAMHHGPDLRDRVSNRDTSMPTLKVINICREGN